MHSGSICRRVFWLNPPPVVVKKFAGGKFEDRIAPTRGRTRPGQSRRKIVALVRFRSSAGRDFFHFRRFRVSTRFLRFQTPNHGGQKNHVCLFPTMFPKFPGRIDARRGRGPRAPARRQFQGARGEFFSTSVVWAPKPTFPEVSLTYGDAPFT